MVDGKERYRNILTFLLRSGIRYFYSHFIGQRPSVAKLDISE